MRIYQLGLASLMFGALACSGEVGSNNDMGLAGTSATGDGTAAGTGTGTATGTGAGTGTSTGADGTATGDSTTAGATPGIDGSGTATTTGDTTGTATGVTDGVVATDLSEFPALELQLDAAPLYARALRLTNDQWENSVRYLLAIDETGHRQNLSADLSGFYDFSNHEELLFLNANLYRDYQTAAEELAAMIASDPNALTAIYPGEDAQGFITTVGRRAFRRPLTQTEVAALQAIYDQGAALTENGSTPFARGAGLVLQALLQSPNFLYRMELAQPGARLSGFEIAAKLSLLLLNVIPDDALLDMAANGQLDTDDGIRAAALSMIEDEVAAETMRTFHGELFLFDRYLQINKDAESVPEYTPELNQELQEAAYLFFDRIFRQNLGLRDMLTSTVGFVGPNMAPIYGVQAPAQGFQEVDLGVERAGFFTQLPFLILNAVNKTPDSIHRGVALNGDVLCGVIPLPPNVVVELLPAEPDQTNRERVTATSGPGTCGASCHAPYINPLGFAFENYDGMGRLRDLDNGKPVDTRSAYPFVEGLMEFSGAPELMQIMAEGQQAHACYAKHLANFALQRELTEDDRPLIDTVAASSLAGSSVKDLVLSLVTNPAFTMRATGGAQ